MMAGDASLGITPVMKWNFERSCYRWLVTRHPAQFERLDFTAEILQSASRARKAFYECGWEEAKVLIRPSDGKFERTPFFDAIIRRGLRNSTRFDAATLTEDEIEALGMHRDETLGFKLQIRHFRSSRKELPPQGRARKHPGAPGASPGMEPSGTANMGRNSAVNVHPPAGGGGGFGSRGSGRDMGTHRGYPYAPEHQSWSAAEGSSAIGRSSGQPQWADDTARWHRRGVNGTDGGGRGEGSTMDAGSGERWSAAAWNASQWGGGDANAIGNDRDRHRFGALNRAPSHPSQQQQQQQQPQHAQQAPLPPPGMAQASASASAAGVGTTHRARAGWDGPSAGRVWGDMDRRRGGSSWHPAAAATAADGRGEGYESIASNGVVNDEQGGCGVGFQPGGGREPHKLAAGSGSGSGSGGYHFPQSAVQQQQQRRMGTRGSPTGIGGVPAGPPPSFMLGAVGIDAPGTGTGPGSAPARVGGSPVSSPSAGVPPVAGGGGSLLSQGYRRLAAMADEHAASASSSAAAAGNKPDTLNGGGGLGQRAAPLAPAPSHPPQHQSPSRPLPPLAPRQYREGAGESAVAIGSGNGDGKANGSANCSGNGSGNGGNGTAGGRGQFSSRPLSLPPGGGEDGPAKKKRRPSVGGSERLFSGDLPQHQQYQQQQHQQPDSSSAIAVSGGREVSNGSSTAGPQLMEVLSSPPVAAPGLQQASNGGELLARELAESERQLLSARAALDFAQARFAEASRTHTAKMDEINAATAQLHVRSIPTYQQQQEEEGAEDTLKHCGSLHSLARSCEVAAASNTDTLPAAGAARGGDPAADAEDGNNQDRHSRDTKMALGRRSAAVDPAAAAAGRTLDAAGQPTPPPPDVISPPRNLPRSRPTSSASSIDCADEMREVEAEAALLCGIGRAVPRRAAAAAADRTREAAVTAASLPSTAMAALPRMSSAPHPPSFRRPVGGGSFPTPADASRFADAAAAAAAASAALDNSGGGGNKLIPMAQAPGSPSASGETDSDHSDSMGGATGYDASSEHKQQRHQRQQRQQRQQQRTPPAGGNGGPELWGGFPGRIGGGVGGGGDRHASPLAMLAAAGTRGNDGLSCA